MRRETLESIGILLLLVIGLVFAHGLHLPHSHPKAQGDPDPGNVRLSTITEVLQVIPPGASVAYTNSAKPHWDSCDGKRSTYGWNDATATANFTTKMSDDSVVKLATTKLSKLGWVQAKKVVLSGRPVVTWQRTLEGTPALVQLQARTDSRSWDLYATAKPVGKRASGC